MNENLKGLVKFLAKWGLWGPSLFILTIALELLFLGSYAQFMEVSSREALGAPRFLALAAGMALVMFIAGLLFPWLARRESLREVFEEYELTPPNYGYQYYAGSALTLALSLAFIGGLIYLYPATYSNDVLVVRVAIFDSVADASKDDSEALREEILVALKKLQDDHVPLSVHEYDNSVPWTNDEEAKKKARKIARKWRNRSHVFITCKVYSAAKSPYSTCLIVTEGKLGRKRLEGLAEEEIENQASDTKTLISKSANQSISTVSLVHGLAYYNTDAKDDIEKALSIWKSVEDDNEASELIRLIGNAHLDLMQFAENTHEKTALAKTAIAKYNSILDNSSEYEVPLLKAKTVRSKGVAYSRLYHLYEEKEYLEKAIELYKKSIEILKPMADEEARIDLVKAKIDLSNAYFESTENDHIPDKYDFAISCYKEALDVFPVEDNPDDHAKVLDNLGILYTEKTTGDRDQNRKEAIKYFIKAIDIQKKYKLRNGYAKSNFDLGNAYLDLPSGKSEKTLKKAIICFQNALNFYKAEEFLLDHAKVSHNLGCAEQRLFTETGKEKYRASAINHYLEASRAYKKSGLSNDAQRAKDLADTLENLEQ